MPLFYIYTYMARRPDEVDPVEVYIYAESEKQARKFYEKQFGVEPGKLVRRENW